MLYLCHLLFLYWLSLGYIYIFCILKLSKLLYTFILINWRFHDLFQQNKLRSFSYFLIDFLHYNFTLYFQYCNFIWANVSSFGFQLSTTGKGLSDLKSLTSHSSHNLPRSQIRIFSFLSFTSLFVKQCLRIISFAKKTHGLFHKWY